MLTFVDGDLTHFALLKCETKLFLSREGLLYAFGVTAVYRALLCCSS